MTEQETRPSEQTRASTTTSARPDTQVAEPGDSERFSHYVRKEKIVEAAVAGTPVIALCGKVWVPNRDPQRFPICPACQDILDKAFPPDDAPGE
jgi:hypothetical protein